MRRDRGQHRTRGGGGRLSGRSMFDGLDASALDRVAETLGTRMIQGSALALAEMARDDTLDPTMMSAGLLKAHLLGAAAALQSALNAGTLVGEDLAIIARDAAGVMTDALRKMKAAA